MGYDVEHFERHYDPLDPVLTDHMWEVVDHLRERCPVAHSDATFGNTGVEQFWILTRYEDVFSVLQDWQTFSSDFSAYPSLLRKGGMPPIGTDPPLQRAFRRLLNPYLTPKSLAPREAEIRRIVTRLIDDFIEDGRCDLVGQLARKFPPLVLYEVLFGIDDGPALEKNLGWMQKMIFSPHAPDRMETMAAWIGWVEELVAERRAAPRRDDVVDGLLYGTVDGRALTDAEINGAIRLLILGGFSTTTDAISTSMFELAKNPELQVRLRAEPALIAVLFDEVLRLEPPVITLPRMCTRDATLGGQAVKQGDQVLMHFGGANRDPEEFGRPADLDIERARNRHLSFGAGPHRCLGSNLARLNHRIVFEELLARLGELRVAEGDAPRHAPASPAWGFDYLPLTFAPGERIGGSQ